MGRSVQPVVPRSLERYVCSAAPAAEPTGFPGVSGLGAGNPGPGDREAGSFVPLQGPKRSGLGDRSSEVWRGVC